MTNKNYRYLAIVAFAILVVIVFFVRGTPSGIKGEYLSTDVARLPAATPTEIVELRDGDRYTITAGFVKKEINGTAYRMLAYNGSIPGPFLKIPQGAEVTINFKNDTGVKTLFHSHGVRMDNAFDGSQTSQREMEDGETFSYQLKFPDAGMYWYHPHVREDFEQELGLYGNYLVTPSDTDYWSPVNREVPLFLDDILIENERIPLSSKEADHTLMGRFGNVMLVNGVTDYVLSVTQGEVVRFYITNTANTRPFSFALEGLKIKRVGADGGAYERDEWVDAVTLGPSERAIIEVLFDTAGTFKIRNRTPDKTYALGEIVVGKGSVADSYTSTANTLRSHRETIRSIDPLRPYLDRAPHKSVLLSLDMGGETVSMQGMGTGMGSMQQMSGSMMGSGDGGIEWEDTNAMMNKMSTTRNIQWSIVDETTRKKNMDIDWSFTRGEPVKVRISNNDPRTPHPMQHPIHFHGQRFLIVARNDIKETNFVWKDTVFIPAGETVDIMLDTSNPGTWMMHCHIAEHLEAGMMMKFTVQ